MQKSNKSPHLVTLVGAKKSFMMLVRGQAGFSYDYDEEVEVDSKKKDDTKMDMKG